MYEPKFPFVGYVQPVADLLNVSGVRVLGNHSSCDLASSGDVGNRTRHGLDWHSRRGYSATNQHGRHPTDREKFWRHR